MLKHTKSIIVYLRSLICTIPLFALFSPKIPEGVKVDFYCNMLSRKCLLHITDTEAHSFTDTQKNSQWFSGFTFTFTHGVCLLMVQRIQHQSVTEKENQSDKNQVQHFFKTTYMEIKLMRVKWTKNLKYHTQETSSAHKIYLILIWVSEI